MMNKLQKGQIRNNSILILIGILIITIFFNEKSWLRYFNILAIILILKGLIWFISNSEELLFHLFPTKTIRDKKPNKVDEFAKKLAMPLFFGGLILLIVQMSSIDYLIEESKFWKIFGFIGLTISAIILIILQKTSKTIFQDSGRRYTIIFGFTIGITFLIISTASLLNSSLSDKKTNEKEYLITKKTNGGKRGESRWIFLKIDNSEKRFQVFHEFWNKIEIGEKLILETKKGYFGFEIVDKIKPTANNAHKKLLNSN